MPHIEMTVAALRSVGRSPSTTRAPTPGRSSLPRSARGRLPIEPDLSNATPFLAAAAVTGGTVTVPHWPAATTQAGDAIRGILTADGLHRRASRGRPEVTGPDRLDPVDLDLHDVGELTPTIAALPLFASGPSRLRGIGHLRGHETDRIAALAADIARTGRRCRRGQGRA